MQENSINKYIKLVQAHNSNLLNIIPNLDDNDLRKGNNGRICIIGGSEEYTGAPYYASMAALYGVIYF